MERYLKLEIERLEMTIRHKRKQLNDCAYDLDVMKSLIHDIEKLKTEKWTFAPIEHLNNQNDSFYHDMCICLEEELKYLDQIINQ